MPVVVIPRWANEAHLHRKFPNAMAFLELLEAIHYHEYQRGFRP